MMDTSGGCDKAVKKSLQSGQLNLVGRELDAIPATVFRPDGVAEGDWWTHCELLSVDLSHNNIRTIDPQISSLQQLQCLMLSHNQIESLPLELSELPELSKLHLQHNRIAEYPAGLMLASLLDLSLSSNGIVSVPSELGQAHQLQQLALDGNKIERLPASLSTLSSLRKLQLQHNQLQRLGDEHVLGLTALQEIDISYNQLQSIPEGLLCLPSLIRCDARHNRIAEFPLVGEGAVLAELFMGFNQISVLDGSVGALSALTVLDLGDNKLKVLPDGVAALKRLKLLDVRNNDLSNLPPKLSLIECLNKIVLDGNPLRAIRRNLVEQGTRAVLDSLRMKLSDEDIHGATQDFSLETLLRDAHQYKSLDLSQRGSGSVPEEAFSVQLHQLKLNQMNLTALPEAIAGEHAEALKELHLIGNKLTSLPGCVAALRSLTELNMSTNMLAQVPAVLGELPNLKWLDLSRNQLHTCTLPVMGSLEELHLGANQMSCMPAGIEAQASLRVLDLSTNQIVSIADEQLRSLKLVHTIDVSNNELKELPLCLGHMPELRTLVLNGNPLRSVRHQIITKGTAAVLEYLRGREPPKAAGGPAEDEAAAGGAEEAAEALQEMDRQIGELEDLIVAPGLSGPKTYALKKQLAMAKAAKKRKEREIAAKQ